MDDELANLARAYLEAFERVEAFAESMDRDGADDAVTFLDDATERLQGYFLRDMNRD